jgi:hypothetical protein
LTLSFHAISDPAWFHGLSKLHLSCCIICFASLLLAAWRQQQEADFQHALLCIISPAAFCQQSWMYRYQQPWHA